MTTAIRRSSRPPACAALLLFLSHAAFAAQGTPPPAAAAQTPAVQSPPPAAQAPFPNRLNERLPEWLRVRGEFRERLEGFDGGSFVEGRQDLYWLSRFRLNVTVTPSRLLSFHTQVQDARVAKKTVGPTGAPFEAPIDVRLAFADIGAATSRVSVRAGRQELVYGEQRLVGHVAWLNAARAFDAVKLTLRTKRAVVDVFGASVVRTLNGAFDKSGNGNRFAGAYVTLAGPADVGRHFPTVEPFVFWRRDVNLAAEAGGAGDLEQTTAGVRVTGRLPARLDYAIEMAIQRGVIAADDIAAWAGHWQLRHSLPGTAAARLIAEYNYASGDADPTDGMRGTFDQLYPTPHDKYGLADQIGWKNIHHARAGFEIAPFKGLPVSTNYHSWWLAEPRDGLYTAGSALLARVADSPVDRHVGQEVDVQITRGITPQIQVAAGYAHIFTGAFLKQATPGASYSHPYVMVTYVFLAER